MTKKKQFDYGPCVYTGDCAPDASLTEWGCASAFEGFLTLPAGGFFICSFWSRHIASICKTNDGDDDDDEGVRYSGKDFDELNQTDTVSFFLLLALLDVVSVDVYLKNGEAACE